MYRCCRCTTTLRREVTEGGEAVLRCPTCQRAVLAKLARYATDFCARIADPQPRLLNDGRVFVPSTDPRHHGADRGYIVSDGVCSCGKAACRHIGKAKRVQPVYQTRSDSVQA